MREELQGQLAGLMTMDDVAAYLNIAPLTAVRKARAGKKTGFPAFKLKGSGQWLCRPKDLDAWIDSQKAEQGPRLPSAAQIGRVSGMRGEAAR